MKIYRVLKDNQFIHVSTPGEYAGWIPGKIFGRLDCKSGMKIKKENRVFFRNLEDAVKEGYRPCKKCRPINEEDFQRIKDLVPQYRNVEEFYNRND